MATAGTAEDLSSLINKQASFCLNESAAAPHGNLFIGDDRLTLNSDADGETVVWLYMCLYACVCACVLLFAAVS